MQKAVLLILGTLCSLCPKILQAESSNAQSGSSPMKHCLSFNTLTLAKTKTYDMQESTLFNKVIMRWPIEQKNVWVKKRSVTSALKDSKGGQLWWVCPLPLPEPTALMQESPQLSTDYPPLAGGNRQVLGLPQWPRAENPPSNAGDVGSIPGQDIKTPHAKGAN